MKFQLREGYTREEIHREVGGSVQSYLPTLNGRVVAACLNRSDTTNPDAPDIVLPGLGPTIRRVAEQFAAQGSAVPTFIKRSVNNWEYVGQYRVLHQCFERGEIEKQSRNAKRVGDVSSVLFLVRHDD